ncbi:IclR family transcriptional regulator [Ferrovibrio sp. MS7]|uniref:IclR family transcriptional regulator n=1 Tax=Ferrovibrio plantarum TaxID=3119164 RepID=UPI001B70AFD6|nr:IclR family transcriptional regulator [Ferrovibrio sp.]
MDKTVVKALTLLEELSISEQPRGVTELAVSLNLTKANVHRLLRTLMDQGYVVQEGERGGYVLSMKLWELGSRSLRRLSLTEVARPVVRQLCIDANESVQLAVPEGLMMVYVDKADSPHPLRAITQIGSRVPMHCVSCGKAMLAFSEPLSAQLQYPLQRHSSATIITKAAMARELADIRDKGFAVNRGEWREGIWGIAAPIRDASGAVMASIDVWGPRERFDGAATAVLGAHVKRAAEEISNKLGYSAGEGRRDMAGAA